MARAKNKKICVICGASFFDPPSGGKTTCSPACRSKRAANARRSLTGDQKIRWSPVSKAARRADPAVLEQMAEIQPAGRQAAARNPENQRGPQNRESMVWTIFAPDSDEPIVITNLRDWARRNYNLFEPGSDDIEASARRIAAGFQAIQQTLSGKRGSSSRQRGATSYKGWTMRSLPRNKEE